MVKAQKITIICMIFSILLVTFIAGCSGTTTSTTSPTATTETSTTANNSPFTTQELEQLVADSMAATQGADSYKFNMDMTTALINGNGSGAGDTIMTAEAVFDEKQNQMSMTIDMTINDTSSGTQSTDMALYVLTDYVYLKATVPGLGEQWIKTAVSQDVLDTFDASLVQEEMDVMVDPESIEYIEETTVNGIACYVIKVTPNTEYLLEYAKEQASANADIDLNDVQDAADLFREASYTFSIAKDTKFVIKMEFVTVMQMPAESDTTTTDIRGTVNLFDYNVPVTITLPEGASNAVEVSEDMLSGQ